MKLIAKGAEAEIYEDNGAILKKRISKKYRIAEIDNKLIISRTKREAKILEKLKSLGGNAPELIRAEKGGLVMEKLVGGPLRDCLIKNNMFELMEKVGQQVGLIHQNDIFHGDLTTSNMIYSNEKVFLIDFGLSAFTTKIEDKAVDIHVLKQALEATHNSIWESAFDAFAESYTDSYKDSNAVLARLVKVDARGRNKGK